MTDRLNSHSSRERVADSSHPDSSDTASSHASSSTNTVDECSPNAFEMASLKTCLFGTTSKRSTVCTVHGSSCSVAALISSLGDSLAKIPRARAVELGSRAPGPVSGVRWHEWCARFDRHSYSWRTRQICLFGDSGESLETFKRSGIAAYGMYWELDTWAPRTSATGSGYLPTPTATLNMFSPSMQKWAAHRRLWPTPTASASSRGKAARGRNAQGGPSLGEVVAMFPTPLARDHKGKGFDGLPARIDGPLNPRWVEWLMGWPIGWASSEPLGMGKFRQWLRSHSDTFTNDLRNAQHTEHSE